MLRQSMRQLDRQLIELKAFSPTPEIKGIHCEMEAVWRRCKTALIGQILKRYAARSLIDIENQLLLLDKKSNSGKLVVVAGPQRGLSQHVDKLYLAMAWKAPINAAQAEMSAARADFSASLDLRSKAPESTAQIKEGPDQTRIQWVPCDSALTLKAGESAAPERGANVFTSSKSVLRMMEKVTGMCVRVGA